ncbi:hypothetical protein BYT27DRAFT_7212647 [Phlegmacium glaucopus]|nr:hypothetical protein BYT27DRAFT_7212647 [Phlegmacium glaucopus]
MKCRSTVKSQGRAGFGGFGLAQSTDLARHYAGSNHICAIYADKGRWSTQAKYWVSQKDLRLFNQHPDLLYPKAVLFASHTAGPLETDNSPWQMGIRQEEIQTLDVTSKCYDYTAENPDPIVGSHKIYYDHQNSWGIVGTPERGP